MIPIQLYGGPADGLEMEIADDVIELIIPIMLETSKETGLVIRWRDCRYQLENERWIYKGTQRGTTL